MTYPGTRLDPWKSVSHFSTKTFPQLEKVAIFQGDLNIKYCIEFLLSKGDKYLLNEQMNEWMNAWMHLKYDFSSVESMNYRAFQKNCKPLLFIPHTPASASGHLITHLRNKVWEGTNLICRLLEVSTKVPKWNTFCLIFLDKVNIFMYLYIHTFIQYVFRD